MHVQAQHSAGSAVVDLTPPMPPHSLDQVQLALQHRQVQRWDVRLQPGGPMHSQRCMTGQHTHVLHAEQHAMCTVKACSQAVRLTSVGLQSFSHRPFK